MPKFLLLCLALAYFLPTLVALVRHHTHAVAIFVVNLAFGWTGIGWLVAQAWSFTNDPPILETQKSLFRTVLKIVGVCYFALVLAIFLFSGRAATDTMAVMPEKNMSTPQEIPAPAVQPGVPAPADELIGR